MPLLIACLLTPNEFLTLVEKSFVRSLERSTHQQIQTDIFRCRWKTEIQNNFDPVIEGIKLGDDQVFF